MGVCSWVVVDIICPLVYGMIVSIIDERASEVQLSGLWNLLATPLLNGNNNVQSAHFSTFYYQLKSFGARGYVLTFSVTHFVSHKIFVGRFVRNCGKKCGKCGKKCGKCGKCGKKCGKCGEKMWEMWEMSDR